MAHFEIDFHDKNSERYMISGRINQILRDMYSKFVIIDSVDTGDFLYREGQYSVEDIDKGEWSGFKANKDYWGYKECYCWFKQTVKIPDSFKGHHVIYKIIPYQRKWEHDINPQFIICVNGKVVQGGDSNHQYVTLTPCAEGGEELEIAINAYADDWEWKGEIQLGAKLQAFDDVAYCTYFDILTPLKVAKYKDEDSDARINILKALNEACNILDIDTNNREIFRQSCIEASEYLDKNLYGKFEEATCWAVGHTHIDVAWLWRLRQSREKACRSFSTVLRLMEEYPEYKFMSSQAQLYEYVKEDYPEVFEEIKKRVKEGRWEAEGSMWVEADTNVASGEALVRQFLVGKRFFREELGVDNKIMWLPDVFGYSAAIPQLIKKCGMDYFMTTKISWNEYNKFPYDTFKWRGIDGTEVLSHFPPSCHATVNERRDWQTTYNSKLRPLYVLGGYKRYSQKDLSKGYLMSYGFGDGGGGPTIEMLEYGRRMGKGIQGCPVVKQSTSLDFFKDLDKKVSGNKHLPTWCGELYLEFHRGTLTSQARNKKYNRKSECLYHDVETLCAIANKETGLAYPKEELLKNWKTILLNQFHDILPGSSIAQVYEDSKEDYERVLKAGCEMAGKAQSALLSKINLKEDSIVVFNTTGFNRHDAVICEIPCEEEFALFDKNGNETPYQKTFDGKIVFVADVASKGYSTYTVKKTAPKKFDFVDVSDKKASTPYFEVEFNSEYNISKLVHKQTGRSVAPEGEAVGKVIAYQDRPHNHEAWDIKCYFDEKSWELDFKEAELIELGAVRAVYKVDRAFRDSTFTEYYCIYNDLQRIDVDYEADWHEDHVVLKANYPVDVNTTRATFDIQFGNIERSTTTNTTWEFAQFEESMHKWTDLSDNSFGLSVINDCKYGCDVKDGRIRPTLFRCATHPNHIQDREPHSFSFSIYPHAKRANDSDVVKEGYNVNFPLYAIPQKAQAGTLAPEYSLVSCDKENVVIETVKVAEDSDNIIVRAYETWNSKTPVTLTFCGAIEGATECNLMEEEDEAVAFENNTLTATFKPFEIKTFKVKLK
ncbi:MAG: alpha-mannosidase [Clostridia bacterium]|nr:alpha-mannosidase [Clostridia bacterium]